jgi:hypothetical protein
MKYLFYLLIAGSLILGCKRHEDKIELLNNVQGKIVSIVRSLDENNQPKDYNWAISTNLNYLDSLTWVVDNNILVPINLPEEFKIPNLQVIFSGKKFLDKDHELTMPDMRIGFGYSFEILEIKPR